MREWLAEVGRGLLDLLYPPRCVGCGRLGEAFCAACRASVMPVLPPFCSLCGEPTADSVLCLRCQTHPLQIDGIRSVVLFDGVLREAIHRLKYASARDLAYPLADMLGRFWQKMPLPADLVVPVPLHPHRQRERGYNQSALLAQAFGKMVGIPVTTDVLFRCRNTVSQTTLNAQERRANVADAFTCAPGSVQGKRVLLIDDVCTTGATLEACSVALHTAGAISVWALTLARAM